MATIDYRAAADIDTSAAELTITLPGADALNGRTVGPYTLKTLGSGDTTPGHDAVFVTSGTDKINGTLTSIRLTKQWSVISFKSAGAGGWRALFGAGAVSASSSGATGPSNPTAGSPTYRWIDHQCEVTIPRTVPSPIGTYKGDHIWAEIPDQSAGTAMVLGSSTLGSSKAVGEWKPLDIAKCPYNPAYPTSKDVFRIPAAMLKFKDSTSAISCRFYINPYSDQVENPVVRAGQSGATLSVTLSIYPESVHPSGKEYGNADGTFAVVVVGTDNATGVNRTTFSATASFENPDPSVRGWSIWFRGDGEKWTQETAMMDLTVTSVQMVFDTPNVLRNIYFERVLHGLSEDGTVKANSIDEAVNPPVKCTFGLAGTGTLDPDAWKRDRIGSSISVDGTTGKWESIPYVARLKAGNALFDADVLFKRAGSNAAVGINSTGIDIYSAGDATAPYIAASSGGVLVSAGGAGKPYTNITATDVTIQGSGLGYVKADATSVVVASGGTPKVLVASSGVTIYGAGTAKATLDAASLTLDSGGTPKVIVSTSGVDIQQGKLSLTSSGMTVTLDVTSINVGVIGQAGLVVSQSGFTSAIGATGVRVYSSGGFSEMATNLLTVHSGGSFNYNEVAMDAANRCFYIKYNTSGSTFTKTGYTGAYNPVGGLQLEITGGIITGVGFFS